MGFEPTTILSLGVCSTAVLQQLEGFWNLGATRPYSVLDQFLGPGLWARARTKARSSSNFNFIRGNRICWAKSFQFRLISLIKGFHEKFFELPLSIKTFESYFLFTVKLSDACSDQSEAKQKEKKFLNHSFSRRRFFTFLKGSSGVTKLELIPDQLEPGFLLYLLWLEI